jgi:DNA-binding HxlR family transcriptional regulator
MTESKWNLVMDREGLTISNDKFTLTTTGDDPMQMDEIVSELQAMTRRTYGQYCGISRALEMVGERWGLLIVRDLLVEPKTVDELHVGFPMIPVDLLGTRLKELARSGVVRVQDTTAPNREVYELTEYGEALKEIVFALGRWGGMSLKQIHPEEIVTVNSLVIALRATFRPERAAGVNLGFEVRVMDVVLHARIDDGELTAMPGPLPEADLVIEPGLMLKPLLTSQISVADALESEAVKINGDPALLYRFVDLFHMPKLPSPPETR